jgi:hypothetical protein
LCLPGSRLTRRANQGQQAIIAIFADAAKFAAKRACPPPNGLMLGREELCT